jgi:hypothetical protein
VPDPALFRIERDATRAEATDHAVHYEERDWGNTLDDGID